MKKILISSLLCAFTLTAFATLNGNGFYRIKNYGSSRWIHLVDNKASVNFIAGSADLHSLQLTNNTEEIIQDPGSIVYITRLAGNQYDVSSQGVTLGNLVDTTLTIVENGNADGQGLYLMSGTYKGVTKYIGDANTIVSQETGYASVNVSVPKFRQWMIIPVESNSDNYFAVKPEIKANDKFYTSLFTSFAYEPYSEGVKAYYIPQVGYGMAEMVEIIGAVPPGSPVIIECEGETVSDNKLQPIALQDVLPSNALTGNYYEYDGPTAENLTPYDPETMRVLGLCSDGSLGFVVAEDLKYLPANTAFLRVPAGSSPEFKCVTSEEFNANLPQAPENFYMSESVVLTPQGRDEYSGTFEIPANQGTDKDLKIRFYAESENNEEYYIGPYSVSDNDVVLAFNNYETSVPFEYNSPVYWVIPNWEGGDLTITLNLKYQYVKFYSKSAGIDTIVSPSFNLQFNGTTVYAQGAGRIAVYNLAGQKIIDQAGDEVNVSSLPSGIYIAKANGKSLKIIL